MHPIENEFSAQGRLSRDEPCGLADRLRWVGKDLDE